MSHNLRRDRLWCRRTSGSRLAMLFVFLLTAPLQVLLFLQRAAVGFVIFIMLAAKHRTFRSVSACRAFGLVFGLQLFALSSTFEVPFSRSMRTPTFIDDELDFYESWG